MNFYNDIDPKVCAWTQELIKAGFIPPGDVVCKSVSDINPDELTKYTQCHFFNGISGWAFALTLAGWPEDRPVWCASLPCQPFSVAGKGRGTEDERHLWPVFAELIRACKPPAVFGEQVASKAGRDWLAGVFADLEGMGYQRAGADLCAAGVNAPHIRQRLFWVADSGGPGLEEWEEQPAREELQAVERGGDAGGLADATNRTLIGFTEKNGGADGTQELLTKSDGFWAGGTILCRDGKTRRIPSEPALFPLADGLPGRVGLLRGAGNAIVPQVAAEFIAAFIDCQGAQSEQTEEWV
jgi:DNA (cytosine-5)-methyltransferase 1